MTKSTLQAKNDALGLVALGSLIVNLAQGKAHGDLSAQHRLLLTRYRGLVDRYQQVWREYVGLRSLNEDLQRQNREYQRLVDRLRAQVSSLELRLAQKETRP